MNFKIKIQLFTFGTSRALWSYRIRKYGGIKKLYNLETMSRAAQYSDVSLISCQVQNYSVPLRMPKAFMNLLQSGEYTLPIEHYTGGNPGLTDISR